MRLLSPFINSTEEEKGLTKLIRYVRSVDLRWIFSEVAEFDYEAFIAEPQEGSEPKKPVYVVGL
ncbi:hypothetical protein N7495_006226 [Penicillium taxi]|uniref:uncharacterized protein n=1 Tax=Penicillium taxi TaxID=168475 RepID=UPI0025455646|nr:uncharacterized protein N7495_006226 [Penicillium taxi]KAJ5894535.1 hypothetical protein N7495_006226 [Penicillium taxi]